MRTPARFSSASIRSVADDMPSRNAEFFIRGVTTFGYAQSPLILLDGFEVTADDLADVEPDNIENFSILKDATAAASTVRRARTV